MGTIVLHSLMREYERFNVSLETLSSTRVFSWFFSDPQFSRYIDCNSETRRFVDFIIYNLQTIKKFIIYELVIYSLFTCAWHSFFLSIIIFI